MSALKDRPRSQMGNQKININIKEIFEKLLHFIRQQKIQMRTIK